MATPFQLVQCLSEVTGVPLATLVDLDRRLVKGGLRTISGRGLSAARMTPLDAAHLLTAVLVSPQANRAAETVARYAQTRVQPSRSTDRMFGPTGLPTLAELPTQHDFVAGLEALVLAATDGSLARFTAEPGVRPQIEVFAFVRATRGLIRLAGLPGGLTASVSYALPDTDMDQHATGDLEQSRRLSERTILALGRLLARERTDG